MERRQCEIYIFSIQFVPSDQQFREHFFLFNVLIKVGNKKGSFVNLRLFDTGGRQPRPQLYKKLDE